MHAIKQARDLISVLNDMCFSDRDTYDSYAERVKAAMIALDSISGAPGVADVKTALTEAWETASHSASDSYQSCPAPWCTIWQLHPLSTGAHFLGSTSFIAHSRPLRRAFRPEERLITARRIQKLDRDRY